MNDNMFDIFYSLKKSFMNSSVNIGSEESSILAAVTYIKLYNDLHRIEKMTIEDTSDWDSDELLQHIKDCSQYHEAKSLTKDDLQKIINAILIKYPTLE